MEIVDSWRFTQRVCSVVKMRPTDLGDRTRARCTYEAIVWRGNWRRDPTTLRGRDRWPEVGDTFEADGASYEVVEFSDELGWLAMRVDG